MLLPCNESRMPGLWLPTAAAIGSSLVSEGKRSVPGGSSVATAARQQCRDARLKPVVGARCAGCRTRLVSQPAKAENLLWAHRSEQATDAK
jgi:hypothetical protein